MMCETANDLALLDFCRSGTGLRLCDHLREVMVAFGVSIDMVGAGHIHYTESIDTVGVSGILAWRHDTVGSKYEAAVECLEFIHLFPPCVAIVSGEMRIFLEEWIILSGEHLGVCIYIHSCSGGLFEEFLKVVEVMPGYEDTGVIAYAYIHLCDLGVAISSGVRAVKESHSFHAALAHIEHKLHELIDSDILAAHLFEHFLYICVDIVILIFEVGGMAGISSRTLGTIYSQLFQAAFVGIFLSENAGDGLQFLIVFRLSLESYFGSIRNLYIEFLAFGDKLAFHLESATDKAIKGVIIEIGIGDGSEESINYLMRGIRLRCARSTQEVIKNCNASCGIKQKIHTGGSFGKFAAYTSECAAASFRCLLALITEHIHTLCFYK